MTSKRFIISVVVCVYAIFSMYVTPVCAVSMSESDTIAPVQNAPKLEAVLQEAHLIEQRVLYTDGTKEHVIGYGSYYEKNRTPKRLVYGALQCDEHSFTLQFYDRLRGRSRSKTFPFSRGFSVTEIIDIIQEYQNTNRIKCAALGIGVTDRLDHILKYRVLGIDLTDEKKRYYDNLAILTSQLWQQSDITPFLVRLQDDTSESLSYIRETVNASYRADPYNIDVGVYEVSVDKETGEVDPIRADTKIATGVLATLDDYRRQDPEAYDAMVHCAELVKEKYGRKQIAFVNSTAQGGGVALMRHTQLRLARLLGLNIAWYNMLGNNVDEYPTYLQEKYTPYADTLRGVFKITKLFHKLFHNLVPQDELPTEQEIRQNMVPVLKLWGEASAERFKRVAETTDIAAINVDDQQPPWGTTPFFEYLLNVKGLEVTGNYRNHIQIEANLIELATQDKTNTKYQAIRTIWELLFENIKQYTKWFIAHPSTPKIDAFVAKNSLREKDIPWIFHPAHTDLGLDGLTKPLSLEQQRDWLMIYNLRIQKQLFESVENGKKHMYEFNNIPLDLSRPFWSQKSRFDEAKGIPELIALYMKYRIAAYQQGMDLQDIAQLNLIGHGAVDDPSGIPMLQDTYAKVNTWKDHLVNEYNLPEDVVKQIIDDVKIARLDHNDQIMNAVVSGSEIYFQMSTKEGSEINVTEATFKGIPLIAIKGNSSGIPLQVIDLFENASFDENHDDKGMADDVKNATGLLFSSEADEHGEISREARERYTSRIANWLLRLQSDTDLYNTLSKNARTHYRRNTTVSNMLFWLGLEAYSVNDIPQSTNRWARDIFLDLYRNGQNKDAAALKCA